VPTIPQTSTDRNAFSTAFSIADRKPYEKKTLKAFFSLTLPSGLILHGCTYHAKNSARWVGVPARQFKKESGETSWAPLVEFRDDAARKRFQGAALAALDAAGVLR
jgi:hypothetical protein